MKENIVYMQFEWNSCKNHFRQWSSSPRAVHVFYHSFRQSRLVSKYHPLREDSDAKSPFFLPQECQAGYTIDRRIKYLHSLTFQAVVRQELLSTAAAIFVISPPNHRWYMLMEELAY